MADQSKFIEYIDDALEKSKETALSQLFFTYQGIPYPVTMCASETFRALDAFEARADDIVLASYPKCGKERLFLRMHSVFIRQGRAQGEGRKEEAHLHMELAGDQQGAGTKTAKHVGYKVNH